MIETYKIDGMTCNSCKAAVEKNLTNHTDIAQVSVDVEKGEATVTIKKPLTLGELQSLLPKKYSILNKQETNPENVPSAHISTASTNKLSQLKPLFLILLYISAASVLMHHQNWNSRAVMLDFMGLFYIIFSFFKMLDLKGFPESFRMYDPLAKRFPVYANVYPFVETALGLMFLMRIQIPIALVLTILVLGVTTIGVTKTLLENKSIRCACLGTALKLPMTEATFVENAIMLAMAITLLVNVL